MTTGSGSGEGSRGGGDGGRGGAGGSGVGAAGGGVGAGCSGVAKALFRAFSNCSFCTTQFQAFRWNTMLPVEKEGWRSVQRSCAIKLMSFPIIQS